MVPVSGLNWKNKKREILYFVFCELFFLFILFRGIGAEETVSVDKAAETTSGSVETTTMAEVLLQEDYSTQNDNTAAAKQSAAQKKVKTGFVKKNGKIYCYLQNGKKAKGFIKRNKKIYFFDSNGKMVTGFKKIKGRKYYFKKSGVMYRGFLCRKIHQRMIRCYFDKKGRLKTGRFKVGKVEYMAKKKTGEIYYYNNLATVICQRPQLPTGCEITAWTMMVNYAGKKWTRLKRQMLCQGVKIQITDLWEAHIYQVE